MLITPASIRRILQAAAGLGRPWALACLALTAGGAGAAPPAPTAANALQVLHWWTSGSERKAANLLAMRLGEEGVDWVDAAIPGGAGQGAGKVLRSRVLAGQAPDATQIIGASIREWAQLGLLLEFDNVAQAGNWSGVLLPTVYELVQYRRHVVAAPLGIHRVNTLFYNRRLFARLRLAPPTQWAEFDAAAQAFKAAGIRPLALSGEPWQVATLFESLVLAEGGPTLHGDLFVRHSPQAAADPRLAAALLRLRAIKAWSGPAVEERPWTDEVARLARDEAAMLVMGDWAKAELVDAGAVLDDQFGCVAVPGTGRYHLYSIDTLTMFANDYSRAPAQEKLARLIVTPSVQIDYNAIKGSVPVRRDIDPARLDSCARASWTAFAQEPSGLAPSLVHRMATDETSRDAIIAEIHRFFVDDRIAPADTQRRLAAMFRALQLKTGRQPPL